MRRDVSGSGWVLMVGLGLGCAADAAPVGGAEETTTSPPADAGAEESGTVPGVGTSSAGTTGGGEDDGSDESTGAPLPPSPPHACGPGALQSAAAALGAGEWVELQTEGLTDELMDAGGGHYITEYTYKAVFDPTWCRVLFTGGGHQSRQKFVSYDLATNAWQQEPNPSWWCDPFAEVDNQGCVSHAYGHNTIDVDGGRYFYKFRDVRETDLASPFSSAWTDMPGDGSPVPYTSISYFPELAGLVLVDHQSQGLRVLYDGGDTWEGIAGPFEMGPYHTYSLYNPVDGVVLFGGGNDSGALHTLHADGSVTPAPTAPRPFHPQPPDASAFKILAVDPVGGDFLAYAVSGELFALDLDDDAGWVDTGVVLPGNLQLAVAIGDHGVVMFLDGRDNRVVVYAH